MTCSNIWYESDNNSSMYICNSYFLMLDKDVDFNLKRHFTTMQTVYICTIFNNHLAYIFPYTYKAYKWHRSNIEIVPWLIFTIYLMAIRWGKNNHSFSYNENFQRYNISHFPYNIPPILRLSQRMFSYKRIRKITHFMFQCIYESIIEHLPSLQYVSGFFYERCMLSYLYNAHITVAASFAGQLAV